MKIEDVGRNTLEISCKIKETKAKTKLMVSINDYAYIEENIR